MNSITSQEGRSSYLSDSCMKELRKSRSTAEKNAKILEVFNNQLSEEKEEANQLYDSAQDTENSQSTLNTYKCNLSLKRKPTATTMATRDQESQRYESQNEHSQKKEKKKNFGLKREV